MHKRISQDLLTKYLLSAGEISWWNYKAFYFSFSFKDFLFDGGFLRVLKSSSRDLLLLSIESFLIVKGNFSTSKWS